MGTTSTLGDITLTITGIQEVIQRRNTNIIFERSPTVTMGVTRGVRSYEVQAVVRNQADFDSLESLFDSNTQAALVDNQRGEKYSGTYILGDFDAEDRTRSSVNYRVSFTLFDKGVAGPTGGITEFMVGEGAVGE